MAQPPYPVAVLVGSLRKNSFSSRIANALAAHAPASLTLEEVAIGELPLYDQDLETDSPPPAWTAFRERVAASVGVIFVTPEYNRSIPGSLKNAIDVGSRPWGKSLWKGRAGFIISQSPGALGGFGAYHHLNQMTSSLEMVMFPSPGIYLSQVGTLVDDAGQLLQADTGEYFAKMLAGYADWIGRARPA